MASSSIPTRANTSAHQQIDRVKAYLEDRDRLLNPKEFQKSQVEAFPPRPEIEALQQRFITHRYVYSIISPPGCTDDILRAAESEGVQLHTELEVVISIPRSWYKITEPRRVRVCVDIHGGGGFTGRPDGPEWQLKALLEHINRADDIVLLQPSYPLLFESDGLEIRQAEYDMCTWLFTRLAPTLKDLNQNFELDWKHFNFCGNSFGAKLVSHTVFCQIPKHPDKPFELRIKVVHLRSILPGDYIREQGEFMGTLVTVQDAGRISKEMMELKERDCIKPRQAGIKPPGSMLGAYASSVSQMEGKRWRDFWGTSTTDDDIKENGLLPNRDLLVFMEHGTADRHVSLEHAQDFKAMLKGKFPGLYVRLRLAQDQPHAWDYNVSQHEYRDVYDCF